MMENILRKIVIIPDKNYKGRYLLKVIRENDLTNAPMWTKGDILRDLKEILED